MEQVALTLLGYYGSRYIVNFTINKLTDIFIGGTTNIVKKGAKMAWKKATHAPDPPEERIEYELVNMDYEDEILYVTSDPRRHNSIHKSWQGINDASGYNSKYSEDSYGDSDGDYV